MRLDNAPFNLGSGKPSEPPEYYAAEEVEPVTLFGNLGIGAEFTYEGREYIKVAVDIAREKKCCAGSCRRNPYQSFSNSTEVE